MRATITSTSCGTARRSRTGGGPGSTVIGKTDYELFQKEQADFFRLKDQETMRQGRLVDIPSEPIDVKGKRTYLHTMKVPIFIDGKASLLLGISEDITEQLRMSERLAESEGLLSAIAENLPGVVYSYTWTADNRHFFSYISPSVQALWEKPVQVWLGKPFPVEWLHESEKLDFYEAGNRSRAELSQMRWEGRIRVPSGATKWIQLISRPSQATGGNVIWAGIILDITARKEAELQIESERAKTVAAAKMASLGEMAAGIAHEINNPLAIIAGKVHQTEMLIRDGNLEGPKVAENMAKVMSMVDRMARIVRALKSFARETSEESFEQVEIGQIIEETLEFCRARFANREVRLDVGITSRSLVSCRRVEISQVLLNLLNNAFDAVSALPQPRRWVRIDCCDLDRTRVEVSVSDGGPGVPPELHEKIMLPFFTTKEIGKGTGLGLSISRGLIEAHQGFLYLDDRSGKDETRFVFTLPRASQPA